LTSRFFLRHSVLTDILSSIVSELSLLIVQIFDILHLSHPLGSLATMYNVHLRLIGKHIVDFLLVLIELFSLRVTAEALRQKINKKSAICKRVRHHPPNFRIEGEVYHQSFLHGLLGQ